MRNKPIRDSLLRWIGKTRLHCVKRIERDRLEALIRSLRPVRGDAPLIRVGPAGDGGYLVPDDLDGIEYAYSPGVSDESGFELDLSLRGMNVFMADYSVDAPAQTSDRFEFAKKFVGSYTDETHITPDDWKQQTIGAYSGDLLLQMDIEGAEFETILSMSDSLIQQFRIMVIEFHYLHQLWNKPWFLLVERVFRKLLESHSVAHIHPNNCCGSFRSAGLEIPRVAEFTFYRNDRIGHPVFCGNFPHVLDADNTSKKTLVLPPCWYR
ncbi:MAG: FkbM family methyltransferase [Gammaproteobacteria bacterium]|nr:FkbM family methyltransferase [Gammaproteobacteria bacterium]MDH3505887.1 FkbM family methyltransferase [Gammaproteobacteria bacterium]